MRLKDAPEGKIRISKSQGCVQYYHLTQTAPSKQGIYIPKAEKELAEALIQKAYDEKVIRYTDEVTPLIKKLLKVYDDEKLENIFLTLHTERQKSVKPVELTYEQELAAWIRQEYSGKGFKEDAPVIMTNGGVRVRSKSEKIMGDYFESIGVAYKYECPLQLKPLGIVYPDFTFFSPKKKAIIYWEHAGMMDNPEYAQKAVQKIELYEMNGIYPGENLILTFETGSTPINSKVVKKMTERYLI